MHAAASARFCTRRLAIASCVFTTLAAMPSLLAQGPAARGAADRIRETSRIRLGYRADARPFSFKNDAGQPAGYSIAVCQKVVDGVKADLKLSGLTVDWVSVSLDDRFRAVQQGQIDMLCGSDTVTLARRQEVAFSIPIFPGGVGALVRADAPARLKDVLAGRGQVLHPVWRASATQALQARAFSAVSGTTAEKWLAQRMSDLEVIADVVPVGSYDAGVRALLDRKADVFFGERAILLDEAKRSSSSRALTVVDRLFTYEPLALTVARGDDEFRLVVDRALSRIYRSGDIGTLYAAAFGEPDENALTFFRWNAQPD